MADPAADSTTPTLLLKARDLSVSSTFTAHDGHAALVVDPKAPSVKRYSVLLAPTDANPIFQKLKTSWPDIHEVFTFHAILRDSEGVNIVLVLGCTGDRCQRFGTGRNDTEVTPIDEPPLPQGLVDDRLSKDET
jgi:hypothetical protein